MMQFPFDSTSVIQVGNVPIIKGWMVPDGIRSLAMIPAICQWDVWAQKVSEIRYINSV